ncbi:MAG: hypothetical protein IKJ30_01660 [Bacilli bacterium]|nr:hypothetical protein [Bacilli bacterium]
MHKIFKHITWMLTVAVTLITCSGCFEETAGEAVPPAAIVTLTTSPANVTYREMSEELYIGYLGAQRDFAVLVDNLQYNYDHDKGGCQTNEQVGCASAMGQLLIQHGLKATNFTGAASDKNVLMYYTSASAFKNFGNGAEDPNWLTFLAPTKGTEHSDFNDSENVIKNTCGTGSDVEFCQYARDIASQGYSSMVGNAMMLFFHNGDYAGMVSDRSLDPTGKLDANSNHDHDNVIKPTISYDEYYSNMVNAVKERVSVANATADSTVQATKRTLTQINSLNELINLVEGKGIYSAFDDYLLLITTEGFLEEKIGNNYAYESPEDAMNGNGPVAENQGVTGAIDSAIENIMLLFNTASSFNDNCAVKSDVFKAFLQKMLEALMSVAAGAALGAAVGSMIFPGIGTAVGGIIGGIIGFFANEKIGEKLEHANGITGDQYCAIMTSALNDAEVNVPMFSYKISSFADYVAFKQGTVDGNLSKYKKGTLDPVLEEYYEKNLGRCLTQNSRIAVADGLASILIGGLATEYNYADKCEVAVVRNIVGGFYGSPSLLLFVDRNKVDDLHGRATTQLIRETLFTWGLTQIGNIYNLLVNNTMDGIKVKVGAAQLINGFRYCVSTSDTPSCDGLSTHSIPTNSTYVGALKPEDGLEIDLTDAYKRGSNELIKASDYGFKIEDLYRYFRKTSSPGWSDVSTNPEYIGDGLTLETLAENITNSFNANADSWYAVKYGTLTYLVSDNAIIGYDDKNVEPGHDYSVKYYWDGTNEYIFTEEEFFESDANAEYLTRANMSNPGNIKISGAHKNLYIYMPYTTLDGSSNVYTYIV